MSKRYKLKRRDRYHRNQPGYMPPCWCGATNPYYAPIHDNCGGMRVLNCYCGGDFCVCHNHGEMECFGCPDCEDGDDYDEPDFTMDELEWSEKYE